jgi:hypothetical protein
MKIFEIKNYITGEVVKEIDVTDKPDRDIEKIERGCLMNLNTEMYCCGVREVKK